MTQLPYEAEIAAAEAALQRAKELLQQEISDYPNPISGCDAQYVRLISDRTRIASCLRVLDEQPFVATPRMLEPTA
ncbi:hypothetical protein [Erythrobacter sp. YT30]|uniref:hypothetical protein n=1 Tax=Erythrobacter sp. YT30 TaxID=1735012 RepID=UPI00076C0D5F|nr:hypothetical protein [Erythrobacter sp. YT30]KWV91952.1 hypothetical protein AUC45_12375 [Erythrobacter sp. YT30]